MATFTYTAKRELKSGHSADTQYTITTGLLVLDDEMPRPEKEEHRAIGGGASVTVLHRVDEEISVTTAHINSDGTGTPDTDDWREFFFSTSAGESFTFNNGADQTCEMVGTPRRRRSGLHFNFSFRFRVIG